MGSLLSVARQLNNQTIQNAIGAEKAIVISSFRAGFDLFILGPEMALI